MLQPAFYWIKNSELAISEKRYESSIRIDRLHLYVRTMETWVVHLSALLCYIDFVLRVQSVAAWLIGFLSTGTLLIVQFASTQAGKVFQRRASKS